MLLSLALFVVCIIVGTSGQDPFIPFRTTSNFNPVKTTTTLTSDQVTFLRRYVNQRFGLSTAQNLAGCKSPTNNAGLCIPKLVRFGFHSCVGGCNGCINLDSQADNAGLADITNFLQQVYQTDFQVPEGSFITLSSLMTRADFWAFASTEALIQAANHQDGSNPPQPTFTFTWGRPDACPANSPKTSATFAFPEGDQPCATAFAAFKPMGLSTTQVVSLIGAGHSMGEAHEANSNYEGTWAPNMAVLSNSLFTFLSNPSQVGGGYLHQPQQAFMSGSTVRRKWQFKGKSFAAILLDTDVCMFWNSGTPVTTPVLVNGVSLETHSGLLPCSLGGNCGPDTAWMSVTNPRAQFNQDATMFNAANTFASSETTFFQTLSGAWFIMQATGNSRMNSAGLYASDTLFNPCVLFQNTTKCTPGPSPGVPSGGLTPSPPTGLPPGLFPTTGGSTSGGKGSWNNSPLWGSNGWTGGTPTNSGWNNLNTNNVRYATNPGNLWTSQARPVAPSTGYANAPPPRSSVPSGYSGTSFFPPPGGYSGGFTPPQSRPSGYSGSFSSSGGFRPTGYSGGSFSGSYSGGRGGFRFANDGSTVNETETNSTDPGQSVVQSNTSAPSVSINNNNTMHDPTITTEKQESSPSRSGGEKLSGGAIAGIVIGSIVAVLMAAIFTVVVVNSKRSGENV